MCTTERGRSFECEVEGWTKKYEISMEVKWEHQDRNASHLKRKKPQPTQHYVNCFYFFYCNEDEWKPHLSFSQRTRDDYTFLRHVRTISQSPSIWDLDTHLNLWCMVNAGFVSHDWMFCFALSVACWGSTLHTICIYCTKWGRKNCDLDYHPLGHSPCCSFWCKMGQLQQFALCMSRFQ